MKNKLLLLFVVFCAGRAAAQFSAGNTAEYQVGNLPFEKPDDLTTFYNKLNLSYQWQDWRGAIKLERFQRPRNDKDYTELTQRSLRYTRGKFDAALGNFYEILGRGLLLRSYEVPGTLLENPGQRIRYGFYRDLDGALLKYQSNRLDLKFLHGKPLLNSFPPNAESKLRRRHLLDGFESTLRPVSNWALGGAYLRDHLEGKLKEYGSLSLSGNLPHNIQIYSEYAERLGGRNKRFDLSDGSSHAFYAAANFVAGPFGMSAEYKDYNDFFLEYNDPPPLIKEHPYAVLNRSTHLLEPNNETGWQAEIFLNSTKGHTAVLNWTRADSRPFQKNNRFEEWFAEIGYPLGEQMTLKTFFDRSDDELRFEKDRSAGGLYLEREWPRQFGTTLDLEYQTFVRDFKPPHRVKNYVATVTVSKAPKLSAGVIWERTTDPLLTDKATTPRVETAPRHWLGYTLGYQFSNHYLVNLFFLGYN